MIFLYELRALSYIGRILELDGKVKKNQESQWNIFFIYPPLWTEVLLMQVHNKDLNLQFKCQICFPGL